jgi:hypothetical protein
VQHNTIDESVEIRVMGAVKRRIRAKEGETVEGDRKVTATHLTL